jgi:hypothetical protein
LSWLDALSLCTQVGGPFGSPLEPAAASTTVAAGSAFGHLGVPRAAAGEARAGGPGKGVVSRQLSTQPGGINTNGLFGSQLQGAGGSMRAPLAPAGASAGAGGAGGGPGSGLQSRAGMTGGGLARAGSSGLLGVSGSALLSLNLPAINIRRSGPSGDGCGSPLIRTSLDQIQLAVRITAGGSTAGAAAGSAAPAANGPSAAAAAGSSSGIGAAAATAAALQPVLPHLAPGRRQAAVRLQGKMDRLDMILSKLTATANMYGWRLETQEALPPLLPPLPAAAARVKGGGAGHRSRSQPTSPTGERGRGELGAMYRAIGVVEGAACWCQAVAQAMQYMCDTRALGNCGLLTACCGLARTCSSHVNGTSC